MGLRTPRPALRFLGFALLVALFGRSIVAGVRQIPPASPQPADTPVQIAHATIADLAGGNFSRVEERFSAQMKTALPEDRLRAAWTLLVQQGGALKTQGTERITSSSTSTRASTTCSSGYRTGQPWRIQHTRSCR